MNPPRPPRRGQSPVPPPHTARSSSRPFVRWLWVGLAALMAVGIFAAACSYSRALGQPGYATFTDKSSAWLHEHHMGPVVTVVETWLYSRHRPSHAAADPRLFPAGAPTSNYSITLPQLPIPSRSRVHPAWVAGRTDQQGRPISYWSRFEPDPTYPSVTAGVAVISERAHVGLGLGTTQMTATDPTSMASIPQRVWPDLVADFNSGFRFRDITGGLYHHHRLYRPLQDGQASAVIDDTGHLQIGKWGRDLRMSPHVAIVRQNLGLIVDNGQALPTPGDGGIPWGGARLESQYTWRSALGIDQHGNIIYLAGDTMDLPMLAHAMVIAGARTAMQLDIHRGNCSYTTWTTNGLHGMLEPRQLLPTMPTSPHRYFTADRRDFFYITLAGVEPTNHRLAYSLGW